MSFIQRELERIENKIQLILKFSQPSLNIEKMIKKKELYAAQQALKWALDPSCFQSPYNMIMDIKDTNEFIPPSEEKLEIKPSIVGNSPPSRAG